MNKYVKSGIIFLMGTAFGVVPTYFVMKKEFANSLDAAVAEVKLSYSRRNESSESISIAPIEEIEIKETVPIEEKDVEEIVESSEKIAEIYRELENHDPPALITAEEFGSTPYNFDTILLTFFSDEVLTDDDYLPLEPDEIEATTGLDIKRLSNAFDDEGWEEDHLYIRNFERHVDYEIAYSYETFEEYLEKHPYLTN